VEVPLNRQLRCNSNYFLEGVKRGKDITATSLTKSKKKWAGMKKGKRRHVTKERGEEEARKAVDRGGQVG